MAIFLNHWYLRRYLIVTPKTHCLAARPAIAVQQAAVGGLAQWTKKPACTFHMLEISFPILSRASYWCLPCFVWSLNPDVTGNWHHTLPLVVPPLGGPCKVVQLKWTIPNNTFIKRGKKLGDKRWKFRRVFSYMERLDSTMMLPFLNTAFKWNIYKVTEDFGSMVCPIGLH